MHTTGRDAQGMRHRSAAAVFGRILSLGLTGGMILSSLAQAGAPTLEASAFFCRLSFKTVTMFFTTYNAQKPC